MTLIISKNDKKHFEVWFAQTLAIDEEHEKNCELVEMAKFLEVELDYGKSISGSYLKQHSVIKKIARAIDEL